MTYLDIPYTYQHHPVIVDLEIKVCVRITGEGDWIAEGFAVETGWGKRHNYAHANNEDQITKIILAELNSSEDFRQTVEWEIDEQLEAAE